MLTPNSSGNMQKHGYLGCFHAASARENISGVWAIGSAQNTTRTTRTPAFWDTPRRPMITHTKDSHQIPSQNNTKSKLQILKKLPKFQMLKFCKKLYMRHTFWSCFIRCINMKWIQPDLQKLQSGHGMRDGRGTDGRTDRRTDGVKPIYPPNNFVDDDIDNLLPGCSYFSA